MKATGLIGVGLIVTAFSAAIANAGHGSLLDCESLLPFDGRVFAIDGGGPGGTIRIGVSGCYENAGGVAEWAGEGHGGSCQTSFGVYCSDTQDINGACAAVTAHVRGPIGGPVDNDAKFFCH